jgi:hypothetical protein
MKKQLTAAMTAMLIFGTLSLHAQTATTAPATTKKAKPAKAKAETSEQRAIRELQEKLAAQQTQIDELKQQNAAKDAALSSAQSTAATAQSTASTAQSQAAAAAAQAQSAAAAAQSQAADVTTLKSNVTDLQGANANLATTISTTKTDLNEKIDSPDSIHYKGVTISPNGSFIEGATVFRNAGIGDDINTNFKNVPLEHSGQAQLSEFHGSGRQSRLAIKADGTLANVAMTAYYEMDWLSSGTTSNNNQSNSYTLRQRQIWARAAFKSGWNFSGGQMWSLATETTKGLDNGTEILPGVIDAQYTAGFSWERQFGFRVAKNFGNKVWLGASLENAQAQPAGSGANNEFLGATGDGGGLYDNQATYSYNRAPDVIAKMAFEPGWGHWELFGIARFYENRIYPTGGSPYNNTITGGGIGGGFRVPLANKKLSIGLKGLYGDGTGRYGNSQLGDLTFRTDGTMSLLHGFNALGTVEASPTKKLSIYLNYGGEYLGRDIQNGGASGYGLRNADMSGCNVEAVATGGATTPSGTGNCKGNNKDVQEFSAGYWYNFYNGAKGRFRYGLQYSYIERDLWSGAGGTTNPGGKAKGTDNMFFTSVRYYLP